MYQLSRASQDVHEAVEIRAGMGLDLTVRLQMDDVGIQLPLAHLQLPHGARHVPFPFMGHEGARVIQDPRQVAGDEPSDPDPPYRAGFEITPVVGAWMIAFELLAQMFGVVAVDQYERCQRWQR